MIARGRAWAKQWLIAIDQLAAVALCFAPFVLLGRGRVPNADETISSIVGRWAEAGHRWALACEWLIDRLFTALGDGPDHCRRSIERDEF